MKRAAAMTGGVRAAVGVDSRSSRNGGDVATSIKRPETMLRRWDFLWSKLWQRFLWLGFCVLVILVLGFGICSATLSFDFDFPFSFFFLSKS